MICECGELTELHSSEFGELCESCLGVAEFYYPLEEIETNLQVCGIVSVTNAPIPESHTGTVPQAVNEGEMR